jgi:enoyl-CoA hydratase
MSEPVVRVDKREGVAVVTLNRPSALNALSAELRRALAETFDALSDDAEVGAVILTGAGRAFCAGLDLKELGRSGAPGSADPVASGTDLIARIAGCDRPVIGAVNGFAITGGFELALACDILVGSTEARFADTHARVGILPGWGLSQKLPRLIGIQRAKYLSLTGNFLDAETAERWGLLVRVVPPDELLTTCDQIARDVLSCVPEALRGYKRLIDEGFATTFGEGLRREAEASRAHAARVGAEEIARRREDVQARGRSQSGPERG